MLLRKIFCRPVHLTSLVFNVISASFFWLYEDIGISKSLLFCTNVRSFLLTGSGVPTSIDSPPAPSFPSWGSSASKFCLSTPRKDLTSGLNRENFHIYLPYFQWSWTIEYYYLQVGVTRVISYNYWNQIETYDHIEQGVDSKMFYFIFKLIQAGDNH